MPGSSFFFHPGYTELLNFKRYVGPVPHDISYYSKCMLGGILACGITHAGITPLDVAKCNIQVINIYSHRLSILIDEFSR